MAKKTVAAKKRNVKVDANGQSTGELFAWTFVIILLSAVFEKLFLALLDRAVARVLGEEGV